MAAPYRLRFRAVALTLRAGLHSQPLVSVEKGNRTFSQNGATGQFKFHSSKRVGILSHGLKTLPLSDIERQIKLEADAIHDGIVRYAQSREYQLATDSKPVRDLVGSALKALADAILAEQSSLKTSQRQKLPKYGTPLLSINHEKLGLITLGTLLNSISRSEFDDGLAPRATPITYEIGQRCRLERIFDCLRQRQVDVAHELRSRNQNRNAGRRAEEL